VPTGAPESLTVTVCPTASDSRTTSLLSPYRITAGVSNNNVGATVSTVGA